MSAKNTTRAAKTAKTAKNAVKPAVKEESVKFESDSESVKEDPIKEAINAVEEISDEKPTLKKIKKELTPRQKILNNRRYIDNFMERIIELYGEVSKVNVFAFTNKDARGHPFTNRFGKPDTFWSVNVVRALIFTDDDKIELLAKELWELFECTPTLSLNGPQTKNIEADSYLQLTINGSPRVSAKGYKNYSFETMVYSSEEYIQALKKRKDQFNIDTNNNGYRSQYPWFDDSDYMGDAKPVGIEDL